LSPARAALVTGPHGLVTNGNDQPAGRSADPGEPASPQPDPRTLPRPGRVAIEVSAGPHATTVFIRGELDLVTMPVLEEQLRLAVRNSPERLILDMTGTDFMDCGSARLIGRVRSALPAGGQLVIRHPSRSVRRILELTGLDAYCEIEG
jgi:anti-anti-sigma factor